MHPTPSPRRAWRLLVAVAATLTLTAACQHTPSAADPSPALLAASGDAAATPADADAATPDPTAAAHAPDPETSYLFGWGQRPHALAVPHDADSAGPPVTLAPPRPLPLPEIAAATTDLARDRAAILSLVGDYRVSFHFMETAAMSPDAVTRAPYHSWTTEQIRVLEDSERFISLQHTLVMYRQQEDGALSAPMLIKHWRQDWTYEDADLYTFRGDDTWARDARPPEDVAGAWTQSVWQVDDSPRYEAVGRWSHDGNRSVWTGEPAWRPLPRREHSTRSDYDVLEGSHRVVITPTGWLHEQHNWKRRAGERDDPSPTYLASELGLDRYERITAPSMAPADAYWEKTGPYWASVRDAWRQLYADHDRFTLRAKVDDERLYEILFDHAESLMNDDASPDDAAQAIAGAREAIDAFVSIP